MQPLITIDSPTLSTVGIRLATPYATVIPRGAVTVVAGPNGAGKSAFARILERGWNFSTNSLVSPLGRVRAARLEFGDIHSLCCGSARYRQQRYEATSNDDVPPLAAIMSAARLPRVRYILESLGATTDLLRRKINALSSGELRKALIARALADDTNMPELLILDNPFIGLDRESRSALESSLARIAGTGTAVVLAVSAPEDIPDCASALISIADKTVGPTLFSPATELRAAAERLFGGSAAAHETAVPSPALVLSAKAGEPVIELEKCCVSHGPTVILSQMDWRVCHGERWALSGPNGSGKSTLLSLIVADHPQAYSNSVSLFGRRRGNGDSIWEVKRRIGYVSPEACLYFDGGGKTALEIVARGLADTLGFFTRLTAQQFCRANEWMSALGIEALGDRPYNTLSSGEQRMVLIARACVRNPELLILDEPMHGLDPCAKSRVTRVMETLAERDGTTLIVATHVPSELPRSIDHTLRLGRRGGA